MTIKNFPTKFSLLNCLSRVCVCVCVCVCVYVYVYVYVCMSYPFIVSHFGMLRSYVKNAWN